MSTFFSFQSQLVSIMDALSKTAVLEISKLVEIESKMLKIEITRGRNEIASLTEKLQLMENLLWIAQGRRQDAVGRSITPRVRDGSENSCGTLEPHGTRPEIKSESPWESICSSTETSSLHRGEDCSPVEQLTNTVIEQPELIVIKEEPSEADNGTERNRPREKRSEVVTDTQKRSSDVTQHPKVISDQQPTFTECFVTPSSQSSIAGQRRQETDWNPPACTNLDAGRSLGRNIASQSASMAKNMKIHSLRNSAAKRFGCLQCGKSFRCFSQLEIHQRSHTGEKPFRCTLCGKRYAQKGHLYTHQRTHTGEKPYRCPICGKGFIQKCTLDMHQRTHTGEKPFVCIKCGKGFTKNCNLKKHLAVHIDPSVHMYGSESRAPIFSGTTRHGTTSNIAVSQM